MTHRPDIPEPGGPTPSRRSWYRRLRAPLAAAAALAAAGTVFAVVPSASASLPFAIESTDGGGNNVNNPTWGQANRPFARVGTAHYADGISTPVAGPNARAVSNRIIQDNHQNVFSERRVTQWGWTWGQFLDHTFTLRDGSGSTATPFDIPFNASDPMEAFSSNLGVIGMQRSAAAPNTGTSTSNPRQQTNTLPSYIAANPVYGSSAARLDWLRDGTLDGNPTNNAATLMLPGGYLPRKTARGDASTAPATDVDGRLLANPDRAMVAGDPRANENIALTATHTLFAREHNRIVSLLPSTLSQEDKFQIARRVVIAEEQYITYQEFLPAMGVALPQYTGYKSNVNTTLSNEFATVGYRAHSQIHGEIEFDVAADRYTQAQLDSFAAQGVEITPSADEPGMLELAIPLNLMFFNPDLLQNIGEGPIIQSIGDESQYKNDEQIDDALRSILFQVPVPGNTDCLDGPTQPTCFTGVNDLGAIDIQRGRDHGVGTYNQVRQAYGLPAVTSFTQITGESTDQFPSGLNADTPASLDVTQLFDVDGRQIDLNNADAVANTATREVRRTTLAARLKGVYGDVNNIDAFTGIISEKHVPGTEFGETQLAIWTREFQKLRDGDRFYFGNDQGLSFIKKNFGIDFRRTLAQVIIDNTDVDPADVSPNVFLAPDANFPATTCQVTYNFAPIDGTNAFAAVVKIKNTSSQFISGWTLRWQWAQGQQLISDDDIQVYQNGPNGRDVTATDVFFNAIIAPGQEISTSLAATWDRLVNARPFNITLNNRRCAVPQT